MSNKSFICVSLALSAAMSSMQQHCVGAEDGFTETLTNYFNNYCIDCHGADDQMAGVAVNEGVSAGQVLEQRKLWQRVLKIVRVGAMPPDEIEPRPTEDENTQVTSLLEDALFNFDCQQVARPGSPVIQRLNRVEYNNTIQDLFGINLTPADDFPSDDVGEGFDNIGGVLSMSPLLLEKYVAAAEQITAEVIDTTDYSVRQSFVTESTALKPTHDQFEDVQGLRFLTRAGELSFEAKVPARGTYELIFDASAMPRSDDEMEFELKLNGETVKIYAARHRGQPKKFRKKVELTEKSQRVSFEFYGSDDEDAEEEKRSRLGIGRVIVRGPIGKSEPFYSDRHRQLITSAPSGDTTPKQAAVEVMAPLLRRAFRRPVSEDEVNRYRDLTVMMLSERQMTWEQAVAATVQAILVSPDFLFRIEAMPAESESERTLSDHELATRLSYFLWSSMPDEELFRLADEGQLQNTEVISQQIRRMIAGDRSQALVDNFAAQWLNLRLLEGAQPDTRVFNTFSDVLRQDMLTETASVFRKIMVDDQSIDELLTGQFTFVNERLARHYGLKGVQGEEFVEVSLKDTPRRGVLTHASVLTLTSYPRRTSPVQRGKWILENLFGDAPPPPPPNVPELEAADEDTLKLSIREQMAVHRTNPVCASCHQVMDPLGMGLENFDGVGRWREEDFGKPVDASGELPGGTEFSGPVELIDILLDRKDDFRRTLTMKMLTYATGRGLEYYDQCVVDECLQHMKQNDYRFSSLVESIVLSDAFRKRGQPENP